MADTATKKSSSAPAKKAASTRKMLTPAERVAKIEADLAAAKAKLNEKSDKERKLLTDKRAKLEAKITKAQEEIREIDSQLEVLGDGTTPDPDPIVSAQAEAEGDES